MELKTRRKRRGSGFSMIEVMIALAILGFGLLAATAGQLAAIKTSRQSRTQTGAMYLAIQQMELFQSMPSDDVIAAITDPNYPDDPNNPIDPDPNDDDTTTYARSWTLTEDDPENGSISIVIDVDWTDSLGRARTTSLRSLKAEL